MNPYQKRRARFRRGFTPPPLGSVSESPVNPLPKEIAQHTEKTKPTSHRLPLPDASAIQERFVESTLRYFARSEPHFWEESERRFFYSRSDFLGKLRLGKHLEKFDEIIAACREAQFPTLRNGRIEVTFPEKTEEKRKETPDIVFRLAEEVEWGDPLKELGNLVGIHVSPRSLSAHAQELIDLASKVPAGKTAQLPKEHFKSWCYMDCCNAVRKAQAFDPRLFAQRDAIYNWSVSVAKEPLPWLVLPSLDARLDFPPEFSKNGSDS